MIGDIFASIRKRFSGANPTAFDDIGGSGAPSDSQLQAEADQAALEASHVDLTDAGSRIASWLPYRSYRRHDQIFINRDSIGTVLELLPQSGANPDVAERLKGIYARLITDATIQVTLYPSPNIGAQLREYVKLRRADDDAAERSQLLGGRPVRSENTHRQMARRRYAHLMKGARTPLHAGVKSVIRDYRLFVSVTLPGSVMNLSNVDRLLEIRDGLRSTFDSAQFPNETVTAERLIALIREWLNPAELDARRESAGEYDEMRTVGSQCVDRDTEGDWSDPKRVQLRRLGGEQRPAGSEDGVRELRFLSVGKTPKQQALWGMGSVVGDLFQDTLQVPTPFIITMGVSVPDQQIMGNSATTEKVQAERSAKGDLASLSPTMADRNVDWSNALKAVSAGGKLVWTYHQIVLLATPKTAAGAESALRDVWAARGFELVLDAYIHRPALLQAIPMGLSKPFVEDLHRLKRLELRTSGNTIHLAPLIAEPKGTGTPTLLGVGRRGQLMSLDFYDSVEAGKNVAIAGSVGSGKSTLLQEIAAAYASKKALVRVFESGRSFERLTSRIGGQFVRFVRESRICVNPFSMVSDVRMIDGEPCGGIDDDIAMLQPLLAKMASPNKDLDPAIYATLATVIKEEYEKHGRDVMTVTHIRDRYKAGRLYADRPIDQRYLDLAVMLCPFCAEGPYRIFFEGRSTIYFGNDFLVFELQELSSNPHLRGVVQMILLYRVTQEMLEERHRQKVFIMDEAKEALAGSGPDDKVLAEFLEKLYLRVRKYNGSAITATQDIAHYFTSSYGASIWNQSEFLILGRQSENSLKAAEQGEALRIDEPLRRVLASLSGGSKAFKEWYVHSTLFKGVMRLVLNPSTLLLYSNRAEDNIPLDRAIASGKSITEAIDAVLEERGIVESV
jgi:conjugal transfer ATP-binding protein TraC